MCHYTVKPRLERIHKLELVSSSHTLVVRVSANDALGDVELCTEVNQAIP